MLDWLGSRGITTHRLHLHSFRPEDLPLLERTWTDVEVRRYLGGPIAESDLPARRQSVSKDRVATVTLHDGEGVGFCQLGENRTGDTELSYQFLPNTWGNGYGREACSAVLQWAFANLEVARLVAVTQSANYASRRLLEALNMVLVDEFVEFNAPQVMYAIDAY